MNPVKGVKIYNKIDLPDPVMIAGWPGMGNVALGVVSYLRKKLRTVRLADIEIDRFTALDSVVVEGGITRFAKPPDFKFHYSKDSNIIIFEGEAQLPGEAGINLLNKALDLAREFKTRRIYTGAAFPVPVSHKEHPKLYGAVNNRSLKSLLARYGIRAMEGGHISGLNGLLLGFADTKGIEAVCLLATMPQYAIGLSNPKASYVIIDALNRMLGFKTDMGELKEYIKDMDKKMAMIEDKVKDVFTIEEDEPESFSKEKKTPLYITEKIEKLFHEAKNDRSKAAMLKKELDKWDLYALYEDRFLDLFK